MTVTSPIGIRYPELTDDPNVPGDLATMVSDLDSRVVGRFATTGARDTAIPSPSNGQVSYVTGLGLCMRHEGAWVPIPAGIVVEGGVNMGTYVTDVSVGSTEVRQTGITNITTVALLAGRGYEFEAYGSVASSVANTAGYLILRGISGTSAPGAGLGTQIRRERQTCPVAADNGGVYLRAAGRFKVATSGNYSFGVFTNRSVGSGNFGLSAVGEGPVALIRDMGPSTSVTITVS